MMTITRTDEFELPMDALDEISGGRNVPTNEAAIIARVQAKNFANGSIFSGNGSLGDTIDNNNNLP